MRFMGHNSGAGKANSEWGFGHGLDCDRGWSKGASWMRLALITVASGVLNRVGGVNPTEGGSKWLSETYLQEWIMTSCLIMLATSHRPSRIQGHGSLLAGSLNK